MGSVSLLYHQSFKKKAQILKELVESLGYQCMEFLPFRNPKALSQLEPEEQIIIVYFGGNYGAEYLPTLQALPDRPLILIGFYPDKLSGLFTGWNAIRMLILENSAFHREALSPYLQ